MTLQDQNVDQDSKLTPLQSMGRVLFSLSRTQKKIGLALVDLIQLPVSLFISYWLRLGYVLPENLFSWAPYAFVAFTGVILLWLLGFYRTLGRAIEIRSLMIILISCGLTSVSLFYLAWNSNSFFMPRSIPIIFFFLSIVSIGSSRAFVRWIYLYSHDGGSSKKPTLIFGTGDEASQITSIIANSQEFLLVGFLDDDQKLKGNYLRGHRIYSPDELDALVQKYTELKVFLSFREISSERKREIYQKMVRPGIQIELLPALSETIAGRTSLEQARKLRIEDLLERKTVPPIPEIFSESIRGSNILITGGGGSIGSELCQQVLTNQPRKLVILEQSELALYNIESALHEQLIHLDKESSHNTEIDCRLGSASDKLFIRRLLAEVRPDYVFHTAAYKHVPIVENNVIAGVRNNIFSTYVMVSECAAAGISRFTLISTDKAVRPTNVMGATKRVAELIVQAYASTGVSTIFSMVRFGNVLGSSGSVIPVFQKQISDGGPVTVTHPEITRYFMTIPEAAQLVIQASFMAEGGEVFLLDMGAPVKIRDLAQLCIQMHGHTVRDEQNPHGEIEINYSGLRPGEKLYEELLIDNKSSETLHPKILKGNEAFLPIEEIESHLKVFQQAIELGDSQACINELQELVPDFGTEKS